MKSIFIAFLAFFTVLCIANAEEPGPYSDYEFQGKTEKELIKELIERTYELEAKVRTLRHENEAIKLEIFEKNGLYLVKPGDTLGRLAQKYETTVSKILEMNPHIDPRRLRPVMIIRVKEERPENKSVDTTPVSAPR